MYIINIEILIYYYILIKFGIYYLDHNGSKYYVNLKFNLIVVLLRLYSCVHYNYSCTILIL